MYIYVCCFCVFFLRGGSGEVGGGEGGGWGGGWVGWVVQIFLRTLRVEGQKFTLGIQRGTVAVRTYLENPVNTQSVVPCNPEP